MNSELASDFQYVERALAEHRELEHLVEELRSRIPQAGAADRDRIVHDLEHLKARLEEHFQQEEAGGYFEEAISRLPRIAPQVASLQRQHEQFVRVIHDLAELVRADSGQAVWPDLRERFEAFAEKLVAHEHVENELLGRAFNVEIG